MFTRLHQITRHKACPCANPHLHKSQRIPLPDHYLSIRRPSWNPVTCLTRRDDVWHLVDTVVVPLCLSTSTPRGICCRWRRHGSLATRREEGVCILGRQRRTRRRSRGRWLCCTLEQFTVSSTTIRVVVVALKAPRIENERYYPPDNVNETEDQYCHNDEGNNPRWKYIFQPENDGIHGILIAHGTSRRKSFAIRLA